MNRHMLAITLLAACASTIGCGKSETSQGEPTAAKKADTTTAAVKTIDSAAAKEVYESRCGACHGVNGKGDGAGAAALNPKPRDYTDKTWQASVTDEQIRKTILYGGAAVGKSPIMPASPDLDSKPEVLDGLVAIVRGFGK